MRLLIATGPFPPEAGGPATYVKLLMDELPSRGVSVDVLPFRAVARFPYGIKHLLYFAKLLVRGRNADYIFAQDPVSVGLPALVAAKLLRKRFFLRVGGDYAWEQGVQRWQVTESLDVFVASSRHYPFGVRLLAAIEKKVAREAEAVIVSGRYLQRVVSRWGIAPEKIHVVYNAFAPATDVRESKEELKRSLRISGRSIMSIGRLVPWKGMQKVIESFAALRAEFPDAQLFIAGDGPQRARLEETSRRCGTTNAVHFLGTLPQEELFRYLKAADAFVLNTGYEAGLSYQILEAMHIGTPVVTTSAGDNGELITDGKNGFLVPYDDGDALAEVLRKILSGSVDSAAIGAEARRTTGRYTPSRMVDETVRVLTTRI